ncbi:CAAX amino terminal protease [Melia azedarach]|uniref:CAAX amino terminal protease n=1 Tax=Melia azedarach TaxID=155640 RepID=A0ACC1XIV2_MELAZ|nr:CAAX amino terminal protease [Melia azedarach]
MIASLVLQPSFYCFSDSPKLSSFKNWTKQTHAIRLHRSNKLLNFANAKLKRSFNGRLRLSSTCFFNAGKDSKPDSIQDKESKLDWPVLKRWEVPWGWQTASLTSLACGLSFVLTGLVETAAIPYFGLKIEELSLDEKAEILFLDQGITTAVILGVLYGISNTFKPLPDDFFRYDLREPFNLQKGWLLWAGIGLGGAVMAVAATGAATAIFNDGRPPERETDALVRLLPLIGSSSISTACLVGITGVLAPLLEENVFRGFFMVSLTKWVPTPIAVIISAAVFALAHLTPGEFPQLFVLGTALGFSYAQTRNLLTPITIHAFWNSGVILLLTFLQLQGYDLKELLRAAS